MYALPSPARLAKINVACSRASCSSDQTSPALACWLPTSLLLPFAFRAPARMATRGSTRPSLTTSSLRCAWPTMSFFSLFRLAIWWAGEAGLRMPCSTSGDGPRTMAWKGPWSCTSSGHGHARVMGASDEVHKRCSRALHAVEGADMHVRSRSDASGRDSQRKDAVLPTVRAGRSLVGVGHSPRPS